MATRLDQSLIKKIAEKLRKKEKYIREQISKKANRYGISSEAMTVLWAKELGFGTKLAERNLTSEQRTEVRQSLPLVISSSPKLTKTKVPSSKNRIRRANPMKLAVDFLLVDEELKERCADLLTRPKHHDRAINQATLVLEERIRNKSGVPKKYNGKKLGGVDLVNRVIKSNPAETILKLSDDADEQEGFANLFRGTFLAFRNQTHHHITDPGKEEALKVCAFVNVLLETIDGATHTGRTL